MEECDKSLDTSADSTRISSGIMTEDVNPDKAGNHSLVKGMWYSMQWWTLVAHRKRMRSYWEKLISLAILKSTILKEPTCVLGNDIIYAAGNSRKSLRSVLGYTPCTAVNWKIMLLNVITLNNGRLATICLHLKYLNLTVSQVSSVKCIHDIYIHP
jgi:hypothetical protein